jgi:PPM family protein phosphatase
MPQSDQEQANPSWWEQVTRPLRRSFGTAPLGEEPQAAEQPTPEAAPTARGTHPLDPERLPETLDPAGTHPLNPEQLPQPTEHEDTLLDTPEHDLDSTRQLSATHLPGEAPSEISTELPVPTQPTVLAASLRDIGRTRSINQDSIYSFVSSVPRIENDLQLGLFVVADGMGGHSAGEVASRIAITAVARHILAELLLPAIEDTFAASLQEVVTEAVQAANRAIWDHANTEGLDMGTTCTVALILGRTIYIGHVGDSRAYLLSHGRLQQLTTDHSAVGRLIQIGELTAEDAREHPLRSHLYRTIGQTAEVQVDFVQQQIGSATHLMLCSDGLWGMVDDDELAHAIASTTWPQDACATLIELANNAGGEDNISAVVVRL